MHRVGRIFACLLLGLLSNSRAQAAPESYPTNAVRLYAVAGQSNAKLTWANAIKRQLANASELPVQVVHSSHGGNPLRNWYLDEPQINYQADFFSPAGTGQLQRQIAYYRRLGYEPVFAGLFWFQGENEANYGPFEDIRSYMDRFEAMIARLDCRPCRPWRYGRGWLAACRAGSRLQRPNPSISPAMRARFIRSWAVEENIVALDSRQFERYDTVHVTDAGLDAFGAVTGRRFLETFEPVDDRVAVPMPGFAAVLLALLLAAYGLRSIR